MRFISFIIGNKRGVIMQYKMSIDEKEFLKNYHIEDFDRPSIATDIVVFGIAKKEISDTRQLPFQKLQVLLINRASYPYKGYWALAGGFCRKNEEVYETARRELYEETNIKDAYLNVCGIYGDAGRDPRGWIISNAFIALVDSTKCYLKADTDAWDAKWFDFDMKKEIIFQEYEEDTFTMRTRYDLYFQHEEIILTSQIVENKKFKNYHETVEYEIIGNKGVAFDHAKIILDAFKNLQMHAEHDEKIIFDLMPERFTLTELQNVFEIILQKELIKSNFRRKIAEFVTQTEDSEEGRRYRKAKHFKRNIKKFYE